MGALCNRRRHPGLNRQMISDYIRYLGNLRWTSLGYPALYPGFESEPESMEWVSQYAEDCGFRDASNFIAHFKKCIGQTPAAYRRDFGQMP